MIKVLLKNVDNSIEEAIDDIKKVKQSERLLRKLIGIRTIVRIILLSMIIL